MAIVKMNYDEFADIELNVQKAYESLEAAENCWGTNFDNLYNNIVASGYLDSLYDDAISNWRRWKGGITVVAGVATAAGAAAKVAAVVIAGATMGPVGWVALAIAALGAIFGIGRGIKQMTSSEPDWITVSKEVFEQLLYNCMIGSDDNYVRIANLATKFYNIEINLEKIKSKVNEFNVSGANFEDAANTYGLSVRTGGADGTTIVGIETEVVIDGQTVTMDTSEAMSAFYTYAYTVTSTMIAADYLERTYGYEIDYLGLVTNANAFMADTIQSDLYTSEMINLILPAYAPDEKAAYAAASAATGLDESELQAALGDVAALGVTPLFAGLVGASFIGKIGDGKTGTPCAKCGNDPCTCKTGTPCSKCGNDPCTCGSTGGVCKTCGNNPCTCSSGPSGGVCKTCGNNPCTCSSTPVNPGGGACSVCGQSPCICGNNITISEPVDPTVPIDSDIEVELGVLNPDGTVDYDKLAMEEYQFETGLEEIEKFRLQIMDDVEARYTAGDFTSLTKDLQGFGYGTAEIAAILASKSMTINAMLDGNTRQIVAAKAQEMAKADGVDNYQSSYANKPTTDELKDDKKPLKTLHLNSDNKELVDMENELDTLEADYRTKVDDANKLLDEAQVNKQSVDAIKEKYEKEYGTDTSKWSEAAAKEYDEAIDKYNTSAEAANKAIEDANKAKESYQTTRTEFDKACEDYYLSKVISDEESGQTENGAVVDNSSTVGSTGSENVTGNTGSTGGATINPDGSVSFDGNGSTGNTNTGSGDGVTINSDGSVSFGSDTSSTNTGTTPVGTNTTASDDAFLAALGIKSNGSNN